MMEKLKNPFLFALAMLPIAAAGGYFVSRYQMDMYDQATMEAVIRQIGSVNNLILISVIQTIVFACVLGFIGYILSEKVGLMKPFRLEKRALGITLALSALFGILFSLDYWTFGKWIPELDASNATAAGLTLNGWLGAVLYGGIIEEIMLRLFMMSLLAWLGWKLFFRKKETVPTGVFIAANVLAALLFAAGHLPATIAFFGTLTPMILLRGFLLNGGFGLLFGWLYHKHGIQYAMISHALLHIISKTIWSIFT